MNDVWGVVLTLLLLALNAFFVGAEFSLIAARRDRLEALQSQGKNRAKKVIAASEHLSLMLAASQLGITICSILLGRVGEPAIAHLIERPMVLLDIPSQLLHPIGFTLALALVVVLHILFGEMVPKNIALAGPERAAMMLIPLHLYFIKVARPVIALYNWLANATLRLVRVKPKDELETAVTVRQLSEMIGESRDEGLIDAEEHQRLTRALQTSGRTIREVAIPLERLRSVPSATNPVTGARGPTLGSVENVVSETGYSRFPVQDTDGSYTGYLHVKDILELMLDASVSSETIIGPSLVRTLPVLSADTRLDEATNALRRTSAHLGAVVDGGGRTVGVVALEDLVEELVGTVRDGTHQQ